MAKREKFGCSILVSQRPDEPSRIWTQKLCRCNRAADEKFPGICDLICPLSAQDTDGCECKNRLYAGEYCDEKLCRLGERTYCEPELSEIPRRCKMNFKQGSIIDVPFCSCPNGNLTDGICRCNEHYYGVFCEDHRPPRSDEKICTGQCLIK